MTAAGEKMGGRTTAGNGLTISGDVDAACFFLGRDLDADGGKVRASPSPDASL